MKIDRHNYEEFFLLYVDNELQPEERKEVENFIAQCPDLSEELELLKATVMPLTEEEFDSKELLFKKENGINAANFEHHFLLYVDNELNSTEKEAVETFVLQHPEHQQAFLLLKKTKLEAEAIAFPNKSLLYRDEKVRRIAPLRWRMGAAAAVIGLAFFTWTLLRNGQPVVDAPAVAVKPTQLQVTVPQATVQQPVTPQQAPVAKAAQRATEVPSPKMDLQVKKQVPAAIQQQSQPIATAPVKPEAMPQPQQKPGNLNNLPERMVANNTPVQQEAQQVETPIEKNKPQPDVVMIQQARTQTMEGQPALALNTVYKEIDTNDEDRNIYIGSAAINKNKIKGLLKKAAAFLGKGSQDEK